MHRNGYVLDIGVSGGAFDRVINTTSAPSDMYTAMPRTDTIPVSDTDVFKHNL